MPNILIVDDDPQIRKVFRRILEAADYEVAEAADGKEGASKFRDWPPDLVLMDIFMPEQEGLETIRELRWDFPDVKIIAISGGGKSGRMEPLEAAQKFGAALALRKPISREDLLASVKEVLGE
ncbi:response regulator [bacterium]|nr:response regulator [bacterium]